MHLKQETIDTKYTIPISSHRANLLWLHWRKTMLGPSPIAVARNNCPLTLCKAKGPTAWFKSIGLYTTLQFVNTM